MTDRDGATDTRLATYGTLAPGRVNHHRLAGLKGRWRQGTVRGRLVDAGWGAALGYPGLVLDPLGSVVEVDLFESSELPDHWSRLDAFEGPGYRRVVAQVRTADGELAAWIYVVAPKARFSERTDAMCDDEDARSG
jgi:gamma-glutamylcyclotransferase (GGCT)/AIG2-like uncharacterized protein YtfP